MKTNWLAALAVGCLLWSLPETLLGQAGDGALLICGGGPMPETVLRTFVERAGGRQARLVVIPTASESADGDEADRALDVWRKFEPADLRLLHTRDRAVADDDAFAAPLKSATGVWIPGGLQSRLAAAYSNTAVERELKQLVARGGVVGGSSAGAAIMSDVMIRGGNPVAEVATGLGLLEGVVIDQHFLQRNRMQRLWGVLQERPGLVGLGIDESTAVMIEGRTVRVLGQSYALVCMVASTTRPARFDVLKAGDRADLTAWRRAALARSQPAFLPDKVSPPIAPSGALVIVGGGGLPDDVRRRFIELAGGADKRFVVIPSANESPDTSREATWLHAAGVRQIDVLHATCPADADTAANLALLEAADAVWFGGGRQWRLVDALEGTRALQALHAVLRRGGVIGGSSAGATIQGDYLVRGNPLDNTEMMAEGYERGFAFLPGTAIDQHFTQRRRQSDMLALKRRFPQLWGLGVDESTAAVVAGDELEVLGKNRVWLYPPTRDADALPAPVELSAGQRFRFAPAE